MLDYLDSALDPPTLERLEAHFSECAPCRAYLATDRKAKELAAKANRVEMPEEMKSRSAGSRWTSRAAAGR